MGRAEARGGDGVKLLLTEQEQADHWSSPDDCDTESMCQAQLRKVLGWLAEHGRDGRCGELRVTISAHDRTAWRREAGL